jgi:hypothetical protein
VEIDLAGDAVVLEAEVPPDAVVVEPRTDVFVRAVEAQILVELAVGRVARIADFGRPHLPPRTPVAAERADAGGERDRTRGAEGALRTRREHAVRLEDDVVDSVARERRVDAGDVGAFGKPKALRRAAEDFAIERNADGDLKAPGLFRRGQRQNRVRRRRGEDLDPTLILMATERADEIAPLGDEMVAHLAKAAQIVTRGRKVGRIPAEAARLGFGEGDAAFEASFEFRKERRRPHHFEKRRREADGEARPNAVLRQVVEDEKEREIRLEARLEEPVLLQEVRVGGVVDVGEVPVQDETNFGARGHGATSSSGPKAGGVATGGAVRICSRTPSGPRARSSTS